MTERRIMAEFDIDAFQSRFRTRAEAVQARGVPPLEGEARRRFLESAQRDFIDYSLIADGAIAVEDGHLVIRIPLGGEGS
jgi:hypothetical protein